MLAFKRDNGIFKLLDYLVQPIDLLLVVLHLVENVAHLCFGKFTALLERLIDLKCVPSLCICTFTQRMESLAVVIEERLLVLLGPSFLGHFIFNWELVFFFVFCVLCHKVFIPYFLPVGAVLPGASRVLPLLEFSEHLLVKIGVISFHVTSWILQGGHGTELTAIQVWVLLLVTKHG